ncbi:hypothetical protein ACFLRA_03190 [Bdellovibrionota bacterium]
MKRVFVLAFAVLFLIPSIGFGNGLLSSVDQGKREAFRDSLQRFERLYQSYWWVANVKEELKTRQSQDLLGQEISYTYVDLHGRRQQWKGRVDSDSVRLAKNSDNRLYKLFGNLVTQRNQLEASEQALLENLWGVLRGEGTPTAATAGVPEHFEFEMQYVDGDSRETRRARVGIYKVVRDGETSYLLRGAQLEDSNNPGQFISIAPNEGRDNFLSSIGFFTKDFVRYVDPAGLITGTAWDDPQPWCPAQMVDTAPMDLRPISALSRDMDRGGGTGLAPPVLGQGGSQLTLEDDAEMQRLRQQYGALGQQTAAMRAEGLVVLAAQGRRHERDNAGVDPETAGRAKLLVAQVNHLERTQLRSLQRNFDRYDNHSQRLRRELLPRRAQLEHAVGEAERREGQARSRIPRRGLLESIFSIFSSKTSEERAYDSARQDTRRYERSLRDVDKDIRKLQRERESLREDIDGDLRAITEPERFLFFFEIPSFLDETRQMATDLWDGNGDFRGARESTEGYLGELIGEARTQVAAQRRANPNINPGDVRVTFSRDIDPERMIQGIQLFEPIIVQAEETFARDKGFELQGRDGEPSLFRWSRDGWQGSAPLSTHDSQGGQGRLGFSFTPAHTIGEVRTMSLEQISSDATPSIIQWLLSL